MIISLDPPRSRPKGGKRHDGVFVDRPGGMKASFPKVVGVFAISHSQRNPSPLFGVGLIDVIPGSTLSALAAAQPPETRGRLARASDGRTGRLGWKGQTT
jgi:hypothetical protein